jgi:hypothetical protein
MPARRKLTHPFSAQCEAAVGRQDSRITRACSLPEHDPPYPCYMAIRYDDSTIETLI